ncbi:MAG: type II toxin-antitoxin system VapC family toxin [Phenylobacterium sp.]|uniref:type II toxin-antitoxin system VapC family toxin n=1 Tax=Phenylobacterium sp. TaxID=1871053 RepID=UPI0027228EAE|nr:type II toxin-antitoxin system VapC family toxin [Phenylobacterium sp.]MDO8901172.1 type II toxin-antitoxin system VapC family toxin [Phenylobacterium sp.]
MSVYLDASAILPLLVEEAASPLVDAFVSGLGEPVVVSAFAAGETASAVSRLVRMGRLSADDARGLLDSFDAWRATSAARADLASSDVEVAHLYVRRFDLMLRMPDALHIALCRRERHVLITLDGRMADAARALGVAVQPLT